MFQSDTRSRQWKTTVKNEKFVQVCCRNFFVLGYNKLNVSFSVFKLAFHPPSYSISPPPQLCASDAVLGGFQAATAIFAGIDAIKSKY